MLTDLFRLQADMLTAGRTGGEYRQQLVVE